MKILLKNFSTVNPGGTASLSLKSLNGFTLHALRFVLGGSTFTKAMMNRIQIRVEQKDVINQITGTQLQDINSWHKGANTATDLAFFFGNPDANTYHGQHVTDLDLSVIKNKNGGAATLDIEVDIAVSAVAPTLIAYADVGAPKKDQGVFAPNEGPLFKAFIRSLLTPGAAFNLQPQDIGLGIPGGGILNEYWFHANMTSLEIKKSAIDIWQNVPIEQMNAWQEDYGHPVQAGMYVWSPTYRGYVGELETTLQPDGKTPYPYEHLLSVSAADTINVFAEMATQHQLI